MANFAKQFTCFFILFSICYLSEARDSKFFFKYVHLTKNHVTLPSQVAPLPAPVSAPTPTPAPLTSQISLAPTPSGVDYGYAPAPIESEDFYYGLYTKGTSSSHSAKSTIVDNEEGDELSNENHEELNYEKSNANMYVDANSNNLSDDNGFETSYHEVYNNINGDDTDVGHTSEPEGMSDTRLVGNGNHEELNYEKSNPNTYVDAKSNSLNDDNSFETSNQEVYNNVNGYDTNVGYTSEPEGMSDTRLVNNGKYYYNVDNVTNEDELSKGNKDEEGNNNYGNYKKSKYEFDSMEEYEKQEGYPSFQQQFP